MQVYLSIKYHHDQSNRELIETISSAIEACGVDSLCVARDLERWGAVVFTDQELMQRSFAAIQASDLVIVELSEKGVGLGIEAGFAVAVGKPLMIAAPVGVDISHTLAGIAVDVVLYENATALAGALRPILSRLGATRSDAGA